MQIQLPPEQLSFLDGLVANGQFTSPDAAISEGVRLLHLQQQLKQDVAAGIEDIDDGRIHNHSSVFNELKAMAAEVDSQA